MIVMRETERKATAGGPQRDCRCVGRVSSSLCYAIHRKKVPLKPKPGLNGPPDRPRSYRGPADTRQKDLRVLHNVI